MVCQFVAGLFGLAGDHDTDTHVDAHAGDAHVGDAEHEFHHDHDHGSNWFLGLLTFRSIAAAITFFGLGGLTANHYQAGELGSFVTALLASVAALYLVASFAVPRNGGAGA